MEDVDAARPNEARPTRFRRLVRAVAPGRGAEPRAEPTRYGASDRPGRVPGAGRTDDPDLSASRADSLTPSPPESTDSLAAAVRELETAQQAAASAERRADTARQQADAARRSADDAQREAARQWRAFTHLIHETYPSVAPDIEALASSPPMDMVDQWLGIARLLSDDVHHRSGGLNAEARERAMHAAVSDALEAQARSSARIAGFHDSELDNEWTPDPSFVGQTVWEHYLCREAVLVRDSLHGEALGNWLGALGELWAAANELLQQSIEHRAFQVLNVHLSRPALSSPSRPHPERADEGTPTVAPDISLPTQDELFRDEPTSTTGPTVTQPDAILAIEVLTAELVDDPAPRLESSTPRPLVTDSVPEPTVDPVEAARVRLRAALKVVEELALW